MTIQKELNTNTSQNKGLESKIEELAQKVHNLEKLLELVAKKVKAGCGECENFYCKGDCEEEEDNKIIGGYYVNGETICELRENPDLEPDPDITDCETKHWEEEPDREEEEACEILCYPYRFGEENCSHCKEKELENQFDPGADFCVIHEIEGCDCEGGEN